METLENIFVAPLLGIDYDRLVSESIGEKREEIADLNRQAMFRGLDAEGNEITPTYRPLTIQMKIAKGQPFDRVTLKDTGAFHGSVFVRPGKKSLSLNASDPKTGALVRKYGDVLGLDDAGTESAAGIIREPVVRNYRRKVFSNQNGV